MANLKTEQTPGGAQQYVRQQPGKTKARTALDVKQTSSGISRPEKKTTIANEILEAKLGGVEAQAAFKEKHGVTYSTAENMIDASFGTEIDKSSGVTDMEKFSQDLMKKEKEKEKEKEKRGMAMGGKVKTKGYATGGRVRAGDVRFNNKRGKTY